MKEPEKLNNNIDSILNEYAIFREKVDNMTKKTVKTEDIFKSFKLKTTSLLENTLTKLREHFILFNIEELNV